MTDPYFYEDESADLAADMDADRRAEDESEMGPRDEWAADRQLLDSDPVTELRAALLNAQKWLVYAAGREAGAEPGQAVLLLQEAADIEVTLKRTAPGRRGA